MTAPRAAPSRRPERDGDAAVLLALFRDVHGGGLAGLDPTLRDALLGRQFAGQRSSYRAAHPTARFDIVEVDGWAVGRVVTAATGVALRLIDIALLPELRGYGVGTAVLRALQAEARTLRLPMRLSVLRANAGAVRLYTRIGFVPAGGSDAHLDLESPP